MASSFAAADALSSAAVSRFMGEKLQLIPWIGAGRFTAGGPDPARPAVEFWGILAGALGSQNIGGDRKGSDFQGSVTTRDRMLSVDLVDWPGAKKGDRVRAIEQPGQPLYEIVADPLIDGMNRYQAPMVTSS